jgi:23S rRNA G2069 N7-methylase RlmK/C1962 C5-methylase RlmI
MCHSLSAFKIIVGDCVEILNQFITEGRKFDYVFGDLTDIPLSATPQGEMWDFIRLILNSSMAVLKSEGKYMTHVSISISYIHLLCWRNVKFCINHAFRFQNRWN